MHVKTGRAIAWMSALLLASWGNAAVAQGCEGLDGTASSNSGEVVTYRMTEIPTRALLGRDGSRVEINPSSSLLAPTVGYSGITPPTHWANRANLALYNDRQGKDSFRFLSRNGQLRICRIDRADGEIERFQYDELGHMVGWQRLSKEKDGTLTLEQQRCFYYGPQGRMEGYASADGVLDCGALEASQAQSRYLYDDAGMLTRVIQRNVPADTDGVTLDRVVLYREGKATHYIVGGPQTLPVSFPVPTSDQTRSKGLAFAAGGDGIIKLSRPRFEIDTGPFWLNHDWQLVTIHPEAANTQPVYAYYDKVIASGTVGEDHLIRPPEKVQDEIWAVLRKDPELVYLTQSSHMYAVIPVYPSWAFKRCLDPARPEPTACPAHPETLDTPERNCLGTQRIPHIAIDQCNEAQTREPAHLNDADFQNQVCWAGVLDGTAREVMPYCDRAVTASAGAWWTRDSRGVARSLAGDYPGAIEDFQSVIDSTDPEMDGYKPKRKEWIRALRKNRSPITPAILASFREE